MYDETLCDFDCTVLRAYDRTIRQDRLRMTFGMSGPRRDPYGIDRPSGFPCDSSDLLDLVFAIERGARRPVFADPASSSARRRD